MNRYAFTLIVFLVCMASSHAEAQSTIGSTCGTVGWTVLQSNQIVYCNSSNLWAVGEEITTTGNVGIGTTSPVASLDLSQKTDALALPSGTSAQRPSSPVNGMVRYNSTTTPTVEAYVNGAWAALMASSSTITLGTSASATNPQVSGDATTGLYSDAGGQVKVAVNGYQALDVNSSSLALSGNLYFGKGQSMFWNDLNDSINTSDGPNYFSNGTNNVMAFNTYYGTWVFRDSGDGNVVMSIWSDTSVGIATLYPQATLDVNGFARLALNSSAPATCGTGNEGSIALTHLAQACICDTTPAWHILNTSTACSW